MSKMKDFIIDEQQKEMERLDALYMELSFCADSPVGEHVLTDYNICVFCGGMI